MNNKELITLSILVGAILVIILIGFYTIMTSEKLIYECIQNAPQPELCNSIK